MSRRGWIAADALFLSLFVLSVVVQVNDPDPAAWMAIYGAAALCTGLAVAGRNRLPLPLVTGLVAIAWSVTLAPGVIGHVPFLSMFSAWEMKDIGIEESREMYGLLIVTAWMAVLAVRAARGRRSAKRA